MGIQINGQTDRISAVDGSFSIQDLAEVNVTGVATASNFKTGTSNVHSTGYECANINATGIVTAASANFTGNVSVGGTLTYQDVTNIDSVGVVTARAGVKVPDNQKVFLGTDSDLEIYHDGSNARIRNTTGQLWLQSDNGIRFVDSDVNESTARFTDNGAVELYYDGSKKFETTATGTITTGTATVTEGLVLDGQNGSGKGLRLDLAGSSDYVIQETTTDDVVQFGGTGSSNFFVHNISSGHIGIGTNAPADILHLRNNAPVITTEATNASSGLRVNVLGQTSATSQIFRVQNDNSTLFTILKSGNSEFAGQVKVSSSNASTVAFSVGDTSTGFYNAGSNTIGYSANGTERLRIDSAGNMGLGVTPIAPGNTALHIGETTSGDPVRLHMTTANTGHTTSDGFTLSIDGSSSVVNMIQRENAAIQIYTQNTSRVSVDNSGMTVNNGYRISTNNASSTSLPNPYSLGALASATIPSYPHFTGTWLVMGSLQCNNTWHDLLHSFSDSNGMFHGYSGDASSKNIFQYQYSMTSPAYGVNNLSQRFMNGAWNTGSVSFQIRNNSGAWTLQIKATSHYSTNNVAGFRIMFHSYY